MNLRLWSSRTAPLPKSETKLRQSPHVLTTAQGNELVLLDTKHERYYTLNEVGSRAWALLAVGTTRSAIVKTLCNEYEVTAAGGEHAVDQDIDRLLSDMYEAGLVVEDLDRKPIETGDAHAQHSHSPTVSGIPDKSASKPQ